MQLNAISLRMAHAEGLRGDAMTARADVALAKMAVGMGYGVAIATAAGYGMVTGAAPADKTERQALEATGWKPFSIRVGDTYVDYRRMDPFSSILGIAATLGQPQTPHGKPVDLASAFVSGFLGQLTDKTFLTGLSDFVAAASDETGSNCLLYTSDAADE